MLKIRTRKVRLRRLNLGKALFVLPNLFTVSSIFCGFYSIILLATHELIPATFQAASVAIFFAVFFDTFDGRVARLTKTQSEFGVQLDSLADLISFGAAPSLLVYRWGLENLGMLGYIVAFMFLASGAIRLARFNVMAARQEGSSRFFIGLPIPAAAAMIISLVLFHQANLSGEVAAQAHVAVLVGVLSYLMVSNVRYRTFKDLRPTPRILFLIALFLALFISLGFLFQPAAALLGIFAVYISMGLFEEVVFYRRRRKEDQPKSEEKK